MEWRCLCVRVAWEDGESGSRAHNLVRVGDIKDPGGVASGCPLGPEGGGGGGVGWGGEELPLGSPIALLNQLLALCQL